MITAPTKCFFVIKADGEFASGAVGTLSPTTANDIESIILVSGDIDTDIEAINNMMTGLETIRASTELGSTLKMVEKFNPLYIPGPPESMDEVLLLEASNDAVRFVGMNGNPFTLKTAELKADDEPLIMGKVDYHPFDMPSYTDLMTEHRKTTIN